MSEKAELFFPGKYSMSLSLSSRYMMDSSNCLLNKSLEHQQSLNKLFFFFQMYSYHLRKKNQNSACVCTIDGLVDNPVTHCRRLRWIPGDLEAGVPLL